MAITLKVNGESVTLQSSSDTPLLWALRDELNLTGTKFGCGVAQCGACTVLMDGSAVRSCIMPIEAVAGTEITTIEGLGGDHKVQRAWIDHDVPQCGYCQSGQIMNAVGMLNDNPSPSEDEIKANMDGNICRCGTYNRILAAVKDAAGAA